MKNILKKLDYLLCTYLGLQTVTLSPSIVQIKNNNLIIFYTESFKRHLCRKNWDEINVTNIRQHDKEKLGIAVGKTIANNLIISFDEISFKRDKKNA